MSMQVWRCLVSHFSVSFVSKPLEGGSGLELPKQKPSKEYSKVLYTGRIPHGFYENEMDGIF